MWPHMLTYAQTSRAAPSNTNSPIPTVNSTPSVTKDSTAAMIWVDASVLISRPTAMK